MCNTLLSISDEDVVTTNHLESRSVEIPIGINRCRSFDSCIREFVVEIQHNSSNIRSTSAVVEYLDMLCFNSGDGDSVSEHVDILLRC